ncbi:hypothetical protein GCM10009619_09560 [Williamsia maris]
MQGDADREPRAAQWGGLVLHVAQIEQSVLARESIANLGHPKFASSDAIRQKRADIRDEIEVWVLW